MLTLECSAGDASCEAFLYHVSFFLSNHACMKRCSTIGKNMNYIMWKYGAFECGRIYRVYEFRLGNNVRVTSQLVFTSRELVTKKAAPVSDLHLVSIIACTRSRR